MKYENLCLAKNSLEVPVMSKKVFHICFIDL